MSASRRTFLGMTAAGAAAAPRDRRSPNDRIQIGLIGAGSRGNYLLAELARAKAKGENAQVVAVCDVYKRAFDVPHLASLRRTTDFRELLSWPEVDAVFISAPDFTHSEILTEAVRAKKDAYSEKPFGIDFREAKRAYNVVRASSQVVQVGTQRRSEPGLIGAAKLMQEGIIGKVTRVEMEVHFQEQRWRRDFSHIQSEDLDWPRYLMGRSDRPFDARRFREWQLFRDSSNGIAGLWMSHFIDLVPWFLGSPYPVSAMASGGVYLWKDGRETEDVFSAVLEYPEGCQVRFAMSLTNESGSRNLWYGDKGTLDADALKITGAGSRSKERVVAPVVIERTPVESHMANFLQCVRSRKTPRADVQAGFQHAVAGCMAAESLRTGRAVRFDPSRLEML
jgi:predicted dehydrogenase